MLGMLLAVSAAGLAAGATEPRAAPLPSAPACPMFPADNVWNQDVSAAAGGRRLGHAAVTPSASPPACTPTSAATPATASPSTPCRGTRSPREGALRLRVESDQGPYPIPAQAQDRGRQRPPHADRRPRPLHAVRAVERPPHGAPAGGPAPARSGTSARTRCARTAGRAPTPPACRSCPGWCATTRWRPA